MYEQEILLEALKIFKQTGLIVRVSSRVHGLIFRGNVETMSIQDDFDTGKLVLELRVAEKSEGPAV